MDREILFRGKPIDEGGWVEGYFACVYIDRPATSKIYSPKDVWTYDVSTETIGQYTGLNDRKGNKIFEGDIVKITTRNVTRIVKYISHRMCFAFVHPKNGIFGFEISDNVEVIGNIYDNPELLEVTE